jgi:hypothetical protein
LRILLAGILASAQAAAEEVLVGDFSSARAGSGLPAGWRVAKLPGVAASRFQLVELEGSTVLQMDADGGAATLYRPVRIDPSGTPVLRWRWRVENLIRGADLTRKQGDDLPARLYIMFDYPLDRLSLIESSLMSFFCRA